MAVTFGVIALEGSSSLIAASDICAYSYQFLAGCRKPGFLRRDSQGEDG